MALPGGGGSVHRAILASRSSGVLQLGGRDLLSLPPQVFDPDAALPAEEGTVNWWEVCELTKLVASHNKLTDLPLEVANLSTLTTLDLGHNQLRQLPASLCELSQLKVLDVTGNCFTELPEELAGVTSMVRLLCGGNQLTSLPRALGEHQPALAEISAPNNALQELPVGLSHCHALVRLHLSGNRIAVMGAPALLGMRALTELDLRGNALTALEPAIGGLTSLKVLDLRENGLTVLPPSIGDCAGLVELHVGHNQLSGLPPDIARCGRLSVLDVRKNRLRALPLELCSMQLSLLDLTDNELPSLPPQLGLMTSLRKLPLDGNPLKSIRREVLAGPTPRLLSWLRDKIPDDMGSMGAQRGDQVHTGNVFGGDSSTLAADAAEKMKLGGSQRQELSFPGSGLTHIPPEVWEAGEAGLQSLDVTGNKLSSIDPQDLNRCRELVTLQAGRNALQVWPLPLGASSLPSLVRLCVSFNPIQSAPPGAFASCAATLRVLDLSGVPAAGCLPSGCLSSLRQLEELLMSQASISSFPMEIIDNEPLPALRVLKLSGNQMTDLPQGVTALVRLEELDVSNNDLTNVPPHIGLMTNLRSLQLDGNRLRSIRRPVLERGTKALLEYLRDRIPA